MKQKIVISMQMACKKCTKKAMKIAVKTDGVTKVEIQSDKNQLVVNGDGVDSVKLACLLRKKLQFATIVSVEEEKEKKKEEKEEKKPELIPIHYCHCGYPYEVVAYEPYPGACFIL